MDAETQVVVSQDLVYAVHDGIELRGDLYKPAGSGPFPVVVGATGGGWAQCAYKDFAGWGRHLASHGIALFSIEYRTAGKTKMFPEAANDVMSAVRFIRGEAAKLGLAGDGIALLGSSAGAHLASLAALAWEGLPFRNAYPEDRHAGQPGNVKALVAVYGIYDMYAQWLNDISRNLDMRDSRSQKLIGCTPFENRQLWFDASPISWLGHSRHKPQVFLAYGTADDAIDITIQSEPFQRVLRLAGYQVRPCVIPGAPHFWFSDEPIDEPTSFAGFLAPRLVRFLKRHL